MGEAGWRIASRVARLVPSRILRLATLLHYCPATLSIAIVILAQSSAVIRSLAGEHDDKVQLNHDLTALGAANAVYTRTVFR